MEVESVLVFLKERLEQARKARDTQYRDGYVDALNELFEYVEDELWQEGEE